jgi:YD repeat-containing protein
VAALGLVVGCSEQHTPFPFEPNRPEDFNRTAQYRLRWGETEELLGEVAMVTHEVYQEYYEGLVSEHAVCFDSAGHCLELYYRDRETNQRYTFQYDSLGRRVEEVCYLDSAGTPYDSITAPYTTTTYRYSRNGRTCRARITDPEGKHYTYRLKYDKQGRLHRFIYPDGSRFTYDYDTANRLVRTTFPDASTQTFLYDEEGRLTSMRDRDGSYQWYAPNKPTLHYDTLGRVVEEQYYVNGDPTVTTYRRDDHGNWTRRTQTGLSIPTRIDNRTFKYFTK